MKVGDVIDIRYHADREWIRSDDNTHYVVRTVAEGLVWYDIVGQTSLFSMPDPSSMSDVRRNQSVPADCARPALHGGDSTALIERAIALMLFPGLDSVDAQHEWVAAAAEQLPKESIDRMLQFRGERNEALCAVLEAAR